MGQNCSRHTVWRPPPNTEYSADIWAPELHNLGGRWYVYVACADPRRGNESHRMYVLGGPPGHEDPCNESAWEFLGLVRNLPDQWAIDGTALVLNNELYFSWSGWPDNGTKSDKRQELFIVKMGNPVEAISPPTQICQPQEPWEHSGESGINEGPQFLYSPDGSWTGIAYSCAGSWTRDYKLNTLRYTGGDPLNPQSWQKSNRPLIESRDRPPFGPGHASFLQIGNETWCCMHGTDRETDGWDNRKARLQRVEWMPQGPSMNSGVVGPLVPDPTTFLAAGPPSGVMPPAPQQGGSPQSGGKHGFDKFVDKIKDKVRNF